MTGIPSVDADAALRGGRHPARRAGVLGAIPGADGTKGNDWTGLAIVGAIGLLAAGVVGTMMSRDRNTPDVPRVPLPDPSASPPARKRSR